MSGFVTLFVLTLPSETQNRRQLFSDVVSQMQQQQILVIIVTTGSFKGRVLGAIALLIHKDRKIKLVPYGH